MDKSPLLQLAPSGTAPKLIGDRCLDKALTYPMPDVTFGATGAYQTAVTERMFGFRL